MAATTQRNLKQKFPQQNLLPATKRKKFRATLVKHWTAILAGRRSPYTQYEAHWLDTHLQLRKDGGKGLTAKGLATQELEQLARAAHEKVGCRGEAPDWQSCELMMQEPVEYETQANIGGEDLTYSGANDGFVGIVGICRFAGRRFTLFPRFISRPFWQYSVSVIK